MVTERDSPKAILKKLTKDNQNENECKGESNESSIANKQEGCIRGHSSLPHRGGIGIGFCTRSASHYQGADFIEHLSRCNTLFGLGLYGQHRRTLQRGAGR